VKLGDIACEFNIGKGGAILGMLLLAILIHSLMDAKDLKMLKVKSLAKAQPGKV